jgi:hypothetical protein
MLLGVNRIIPSLTSLVNSKFQIFYANINNGAKDAPLLSFSFAI